MKPHEAITVAWRRELPPALEVAHLQMSGSRLHAKGSSVSGSPEPYRLEYQLQTADGFVTEYVAVVCEGPGWRRSVVLSRDDDEWAVTTEERGTATLPAPGGDLSTVRS